MCVHAWCADADPIADAIAIPVADAASIATLITSLNVMRDTIIYLLRPRVSPEVPWQMDKGHRLWPTAHAVHRQGVLRTAA